MPAPHWFEPVPGSVQVMTPFCDGPTVEVSSALAVVRLNGYGLEIFALTDEGVVGGSGLKIGNP